MPVQGRWFQTVLGFQPVLACLAQRYLRGVDVGSCGYLAADPFQGFPCGGLRWIAFSELFAPPVDRADIDGELITHNRPATCAALKFDPLNLRRQLAALSHGQILAGAMTMVMVQPLCVQR
jgi:hypothetical protein